MEKACKEFSDEYGELTLLRANIATINKMLIKRGKEQELYTTMLEIMKNFEEKESKK